MNINVVTEDLESLISRRMVLDLIENDEGFFKNKTEKTMALRACMDLWDHELSDRDWETKIPGLL